MASKVSSPNWITPRDSALTLHRAGYTVIPVQRDSKKPVEKWIEWETDQSESHIREHWRKDPTHDVGIITDEHLIIFDADSPESIAALESLEAKHQLVPKVIVQTRKGVHHYYRRPDDVFARQTSDCTIKHPERIDIKTDRSFVVGPGSQNKVCIKWEIRNFYDLTPVTHAFVDDIFAHNGRPPPRLQVSNSTTCARPRDGRLPQLRVVLAHIDPDRGYDYWLRVGAVIFNETGGSNDGLDLFDTWSSKGGKYRGTREIEYKWNSFDPDHPNPARLGTLRWMIEAEGLDWLEILASVDEEDFPDLDGEVEGGKG